ncbi:MAG TPA: DNA translocase FtsK [Spirillospora sp.]|nr:DNA translocase FtsK [Spirillospora sp.]
MAQTRNSKPSETAATTDQTPETEDEYPKIERIRYQGRYVVQPEFWDRILDSIPPWIDEIAAIVLIVFGIVSFLSLFNVASDATISNAWSNALTSLFGYGSLVVAGGILALGVVILLPKLGILVKFPPTRVFALELAFLALLAILHLTAGDTEWRAIARAGYGGGVVGWGLSTLIGNLLSSAFALFFYSLIFVLCIAYVSGIRPRHIARALIAVSSRMRGFGHAAAQNLPDMKSAAVNPSNDTAPEPPAQIPPEVSKLNIIRIKPDPENIPPSQRPGAATSTGNPSDEEEFEDVDSLTRRNLGEDHHIIAEFNAIGTLKPKRKKTDVQLVERPDGRIKRYFEVEAMKEPRRIGRRERDLPPLDLMDDIDLVPPSEEEINTNVVLIENTLLEFEIDVDVVDVKVGPTVTQYAVQPFRSNSDEEGDTILHRTRINKIASLANDLALSLAARRLRLETPVPGKSYIGIEVPNKRPSIVSLRSVYESEYFYDLMRKKQSPLLIPLGRDVAGQPVAVDIGQMPHLLIAGTTGSGKSVAIAAIATALLLNNTPDVVKLVMLDPKMVELSRFNGIPHLVGPVETELERIIGVLRWCTREMDRRYKLLEEYSARNIDAYNARLGRRKASERLPYMVIMIDEVGDLMMNQPEETERHLTRLAQMARAVGMHLIVATQRPSVDVLTGLIKANFPTRISFAVASGVDSRVILDTVGAENLLGQGDMLYLASDAAGPRRVQGCFVSDEEVRKIVQHWKDWYEAQIEAGKMERVRVGPWQRGLTRRELLAETDPMLEEAIELVIEEGEASASLIQRKLGLGYPRAARIIDLLYELRVIGPQEPGGRSRKVLLKPGEDPFKEEIERRSRG